MLVSNKNYKAAAIYGILFVLAVISSKTKNMYELPSILNMINVLLNSLVIRLFPIFMMGYYTISSTKPNEFIAAMVKWKIPNAFIIPVSVVFRFIPTLKEENKAISNAMRMRGYDLIVKNKSQSIIVFRVQNYPAPVFCCQNR